MRQRLGRFTPKARLVHLGELLPAFEYCIPSRERDEGADHYENLSHETFRLQSIHDGRNLSLGLFRKVVKFILMAKKKISILILVGISHITRFTLLEYRWGSVSFNVHSLPL